MLNFMFCGRRKQAMKNLISLSELGRGPKEFNSSWVTYIWQSKWVEIIAMKTKTAKIHFLSHVLFAFSSLDL